MKRGVLKKALGELYVALSAHNGKLEELETEYELTQDHWSKLKDNIAFLKREAQVVKLKEFKAAVEAFEYTDGSLVIIATSIGEIRSECQQGLDRVEKLLAEIRALDSELEKGAVIYQFPNDERPDQDAD